MNRLFKHVAQTMVVGSLVCSSWAKADSRDPTGEVARYDVDRAASRTSSMVLGGNMTGSVTGALPDDGSGAAHNVKLDYTLRIQIFGNQSGTRNISVPDLYFSEDFLVDLRANGTFTGPSFKAKHMGYGDARNMDGAFYPNCDRILIYDIQQTDQIGLYDLTRLFLPPFSMTNASAELEDMQILAHVSYGVPVLGAVKLDISGKYQGQNVKAGADYRSH